MIQTLAREPAGNNAARIFRSLQSPHTSRCLPISHTSPGRVTGFAGSSRDFLLGVLRFRFLQQQIFQFVVREADDRKIQALAFDLAQFLGQHLLVPPGVQCELVVRDDVRPPLSLGEVVQHHHRNLPESQLSRRQETAVAGNNPRVGGHQDRSIKTKFDNRRRNLRHLFRRVRPRVPCVRHEPFYRPDLNAARHPRQDRRAHTPHMPAHSAVQFRPR